LGKVVGPWRGGAQAKSLGRSSIGGMWGLRPESQVDHSVIKPEISGSVCSCFDLEWIPETLPSAVMAVLAGLSRRCAMVSQERQENFSRRCWMPASMTAHAPASPHRPCAALCRRSRACRWRRMQEALARQIIRQRTARRTLALEASTWTTLAGAAVYVELRGRPTTSIKLVRLVV
jgi:hypothetical protein